MNVALMGSDKGIQVFALIGLFATALAGWTSSEASDPPAIDQTIPGATKWGYYGGEPVTRWSPDGRNMILVTELRYTDPKGEVWVAPAGSVTDGASIPRYLWSLMGGPFEGQYRNASVLHDAAYEKKNRAMAGLRPDVLLRNALQRGERRRSQDHVLRRLQICASLEISNQARETRQV
jgi:hypothetical protein